MIHDRLLVRVEAVSGAGYVVDRDDRRLDRPIRIIDAERVEPDAEGKHGQRADEICIEEVFEKWPGIDQVLVTGRSDQNGNKVNERERKHGACFTHFFFSRITNQQILTNVSVLHLSPDYHTMSIMNA